MRDIKKDRGALEWAYGMGRRQALTQAASLVLVEAGVELAKKVVNLPLGAGMEASRDRVFSQEVMREHD